MSTEREQADDFMPTAARTRVVLEFLARLGLELEEVDSPERRWLALHVDFERIARPLGRHDRRYLRHLRLGLGLLLLGGHRSRRLLKVGGLMLEDR